jgi:hypothetical protein
MVVQDEAERAAARRRTARSIKRNTVAAVFFVLMTVLWLTALTKPGNVAGVLELEDLTVVALGVVAIYSIQKNVRPQRPARLSPLPVGPIQVTRPLDRIDHGHGHEKDAEEDGAQILSSHDAPNPEDAGEERVYIQMSGCRRTQRPFGSMPSAG